MSGTRAPRLPTEDRVVDEGVIGPTGRFPRGKMHPSDTGEIVIAVGHTAAGKVVVEFGTEISWLGLDPTDAIVMALELKRHAEVARREATGA